MLDGGEAARGGHGRQCARCAYDRRMPPRVIHTAQALVDVVVEVPSLPRRGGNVMADVATRVLMLSCSVSLQSVARWIFGIHLRGVLCRDLGILLPN